MSCVTFITKYVTFYDRSNSICIRNVNFQIRKYVFFLKNYAVTIGKQLLSQSMHHTHCFSVSKPVILFSIIEYIFSILERSLSDPWAILERNTHKQHENASFLPQGSLNDRSRIAQGSISMVSRIDFERTLVYTN